MTYPTRFHSTSQLLVGAFLLLMGTMLLLDNLDLIDVGFVWRHWPLLVVAVGVGKLLHAENASERGKGFWWMFMGAWLYLSVFKLFGLGFRDSWPLLVVGWGVNIVWKSLVPQRSGIVKENYNG